MASPLHYLEGLNVDNGRTDFTPPSAARLTDPQTRPTVRGFVRCRLPGYEPVLARYYKRSGADGMDNRRL